ncbi:hypothetical protein POM88_048239 [Heracleum sosnowskyi]|uniref:DUF4283 domain-containing protein n=1 Tax=Heracleum sosnowskyi TaxID=360622 RepID=A0AAD8GUX3_9APIA|nr:hypothetical protein POM88_048239 [Heracleum sosnowskyi]
MRVFFFFKFECEADLLEVLEDEVCMVEGKPLIMQRWAGMSRIGSGLGNILMVDGLTEKMCREATGRLSFAKLLIEVDAKIPLPDNLYVLIPSEDGREPVEVVVHVEYPWRPSWCAKCLMFGHNVHLFPVMVALHENEMREELEAKKGEKGNDEFTVVHRNEKEKMGSNGGQDQGAYYQGSKVLFNNKKKHGNNFNYVNRGVPLGKSGYGNEKRGYKGETSGVQKLSQGQPIKSILQNNKFSLLASNNLLDNLEAVSTRVDIKSDENLVGREKGRIGVVVEKNGVQEGKLEGVCPVDKCELNSEVDVESDLGETAEFMGEITGGVEETIGEEREKNSDTDSEVEMNQYIIQEVFAEKQGNQPITGNKSNLV